MRLVMEWSICYKQHWLERLTCRWSNVFACSLDDGVPCAQSIDYGVDDGNQEFVDAIFRVKCLLMDQVPYGVEGPRLLIFDVSAADVLNESTSIHPPRCSRRLLVPLCSGFPRRVPSADPRRGGHSPLVATAWRSARMVGGKWCAWRLLPLLSQRWTDLFTRQWAMYGCSSLLEKAYSKPWSGQEQLGGRGDDGHDRGALHHHLVRRLLCEEDQQQAVVQRWWGRWVDGDEVDIVRWRQVLRYDEENLCLSEYLCVCE